MTENRYDFRKRLREVHRKGVRDYDRKPRKDEIIIENGAVVSIPALADVVLLTAVKDFIDYLSVSQGVTARLTADAPGVLEFELLTCDVLTPVKRMENSIEIGENIKISAYNERGLAQGLYRLEQMMNLRRAPFLKKGLYHSAPLFSPRMTHSAYGFDMFPDGYLSQLAHNGIDAVLVCVAGVDKSLIDHMDFNLLCERAAGYGIDVYAYSHLKSRVHPDDEGAAKYYDELYGAIFRSCPRFAGVVLVGESVLFPSRDPRTNGQCEVKARSYDIPSDKPSPGWWPCEDYPRLVMRIRDSVRKYSPSADIVFWTYNWGYAPEEDRLGLINSLPTDISLLVTFEMFEKYKMRHIEGYCADYTLSFAGPGRYYLSEAEAAAARGIRLYAMSNTAGKTWDFGSVPYLPMPYQWIKRYEGLKKSHSEHNLSGLMESHTYGLFPSFISELANMVFSRPDCSIAELLSDVLATHFGESSLPLLKKALLLWSKAITYYTPSNEDQYGAFRIGPAYPFCFKKKFLPKESPRAVYGAAIVIPDYDFPHIDFSPPVALRIGDEIARLEKMKDYIAKGLSLLREICSDNSELSSLINLGEYMYHTVQTGINAKKWHVLKTEIRGESNREKLLTLLGKAKLLLTDEIRNAEAALPLVKEDSSLGFESSMGYLGDAIHIEWKISQVQYVINVELRDYIKRIC